MTSAVDHVALAQRLARLEGFESARALLHDYGVAVDNQDLDAVVALFRPDAILRMPVGTFQGHGSIEEAFRGAWQADPSQKHHFMFGPKLRPRPDETVECTSEFHFIADRADRPRLGWGKYDDIIDTSGAEARFISRSISVHLSSDLAGGWAG